MSQFYASIQGDRKEGTKRGNKNSGIWGHVRGWNSGIKVYGVERNGQDVFEVYLTSGSNGGRSDILIGEFSAHDLKRNFELRRGGNVVGIIANLPQEVAERS